MTAAYHPKRILVTGGAGFIGSNFIRRILRTEDVSIINVDLLTYAGNLRNTEEFIDDPRYSWFKLNIADPAQIAPIFENNRIDAVINFAAETHVDRSILDSTPFVRTNVLGTQCLLDLARRHGVSKFVQISTDEVYGSLGETGAFREDTPLNPSNPYSASKSGGDFLALSYHKTHGLPVVLTRCSNNYGPHQFPEKFMPLLILNALENRPIPVYGDGRNRREWLYVDDHTRGVWNALTLGIAGQVYNIGGGMEMANIDVARLVLRILGKSDSLIMFVKDRPGHDLRYSLDCSKITREWNWKTLTDFEAGVEGTIEWFQNHQEWVREIRNAEYLTYYDRMYANRELRAVTG